MDGIIVIIRLFEPRDAEQCERIIHGATMSTVLPSFWAAVTREIYLQLVVVISAFMFVFTGLSPAYCCLAFPVSACIIYGAVYAAHYIKSTTMTPDISDISASYMSSRGTGFWVAEAVLPQHWVKGTSAPVLIYRASTAFNSNFVEYGSVRSVVGTIGVVYSNSDPAVAWIRRMAVQPEWKRRGIASALLDEALIFARNAGYLSVELVTTECHAEARKLYTNKGFQLKQLYHKQIVPSLVHILMYQYTSSV